MLCSVWWTSLCQFRMKLFNEYLKVNVLCVDSLKWVDSCRKGCKHSSYKPINSCIYQNYLRRHCTKLLFQGFENCWILCFSTTRNFTKECCFLWSRFSHPLQRKLWALHHKCMTIPTPPDIEVTHIQSMIREAKSSRFKLFVTTKKPWLRSDLYPFQTRVSHEYKQNTS